MARAEHVTEDELDTQPDVEINWDDVQVPGVQVLTPEEGRAFFNAQSHELLGISGAEFLRRYDAGEYDAIIDDPAHREIGLLEFLLPFAR
jgi:hypothetical protein